jgi:hypothetical protein
MRLPQLTLRMYRPGSDIARSEHFKAEIAAQLGRSGGPWGDMNGCRRDAASPQI